MRVMSRLGSKTIEATLIPVILALIVPLAFSAGATKEKVTVTATNKVTVEPRR